MLIIDIYHYWFNDWYGWLSYLSPKVAEGFLRWRSGPNHSNWYVRPDPGMHVHMQEVLNIVLWAALKINSIKINVTRAIKVSQWKLNNEHSTSASQTQFANEHLSRMVGMHWGAVIDFVILAYRKGQFFLHHYRLSHSKDFLFSCLVTIKPVAGTLMGWTIHTIRELRRFATGCQHLDLSTCTEQVCFMWGCTMLLDSQARRTWDKRLVLKCVTHRVRANCNTFCGFTHIFSQG